MKSKTKLILTVLISIAFVFAIAFAGSYVLAGAEETTITAEDGDLTGETGTGEEDTDTDTETGTDGETDGTDSTVVETFIEYLKSVYGSNYEYYYNLILENWGSVEEYLLSITDNLPESTQNSWETFVTWLGDYAVVWVPIVAAIAAIVVAVLQYRRTQKYKAQYTTLTEASNQQTTALLAVIEAQKSLLSNNAKFAEQVTALENAEKELNEDV